MMISDEQLKILVEVLTKRNLELVAEALGVKNLGEIATRIHNLDDRIGKVDQEFSERINTLPSSLADNQEFLRKLETVLYDARTKRDDNRMSLIAEAVATYINVQRREKEGERYDPKDDLNPDQIDEKIVALAWNEEVIKGKRVQQIQETIFKWLSTRETAMAEKIAGMLSAKAKGEIDIIPFARNLVCNAVDPKDGGVIREELEKEEAFKGFLKKAK